MVNPKQIGSDFRISLSDDMGSIVPIKSAHELALEHGYTQHRFNPETMGWAYHEPDQSVGDDGRRYVMVPKS